jgi:acyl carrier protein
MEKADILKSLEQVFQKVFKNQELKINENSSPNDIDEWDSINQLTLISDVEEQFKVKFNLNEIIEIEKVQDILDVLDEKLN